MADDNTGLRELAFRNLTAAVIADRQVLPAEETFLEQARVLLGVDEATARHVILTSVRERPAVSVPMAVAERRILFALMVKACLSDGILQKQEESLLRGVAPLFGFTDNDLDEMLRQTAES